MPTARSQKKTVTKKGGAREVGAGTAGEKDGEEEAGHRSYEPAACGNHPATTRGTLSERGLRAAPSQCVGADGGDHTFCAVH